MAWDQPFKLSLLLIELCPPDLLFILLLLMWKATNYFFHLSINRLPLMLLSLLLLLVGEGGLVDQIFGEILLFVVVVVDHLTVNYAELMITMHDHVYI